MEDKDIKQLEKEKEFIENEIKYLNKKIIRIKKGAKRMGRYTTFTRTSSDLFGDFIISYTSSLDLMLKLMQRRDQLDDMIHGRELGAPSIKDTTEAITTHP